MGAALKPYTAQDHARFTLIAAASLILPNVLTGFPPDDKKLHGELFQKFTSPRARVPRDCGVFSWDRMHICWKIEYPLSEPLIGRVLSLTINPGIQPGH